MSKNLALQQTEWDLHETPENFIPLEFTEEIKPDLFGLELTKAQEMTSGLSTTLAEREILKNAYVDVIGLEITTENLPTFKELRLKIVKNRTQGLDKWKEREKAFYLAGGRFVDAIYNKELKVNQEMESKLLETEKFFENQEKEKARLLNLERIEKIRPYVEDVTGLDFAPMTDEDFDDYLLGKKTRFENEKKEREEKEAHEKLERQKNEILHNRQLELAPYVDFIPKGIDLKEMPHRLYANLLFDCKRAKTKKYEEIKAQKLENDRLKKEASKLESELQAKKDAELKAENAKIEAERLAKLEAEKLAKAPIKEQLKSWVNSFDIPDVGVENETSKEIKEKFEAFKKWSINQINNL